MNERDLYWLAGLLEGEGSFLAGPPSAPNSPQISLTMTDEEIVARAAGLLQTTYRKYVKKQPDRLPAYYLSLKGGRAVAIMRLLRPLMGQRRQAQIDKAVACFGLPRSFKRGEQANGAILNEVAVLEIYRRARSGESHKDLATDYGVSKGTIDGIATGRAWAWLTGHVFRATYVREVCRNGHPNTPENQLPKPTGGHRCRICAELHQQRRNQAKREMRRRQREASE
jgi:hypothetical protein